MGLKKQAIVDRELALGSKDILKMSAAMFNKLTYMRRKPVEKGLLDAKGTKKRLSNCQPIDEFIFGEKSFYGSSKPYDRQGGQDR